MKTFILFLFVALFSRCLLAQSHIQSAFWRANIERPDGNGIIFNLRTAEEAGHLVFYVVNGAEEMRVPDVQIKGDSILIAMPVFESGFRLKVVRPDSLSGVWQRASSAHDIQIPFTATAKYPDRFIANQGKPSADLTGKWQVTFSSRSGKTSPAIAEFTQKGSRITGSVLTPFGDDRYLEGIVSGDSLWFSGFDGIHSLLFKAKVSGDRIEGVQYSGATSKTAFTGVRSENPTLPNEAAMFLKKGEDGHLDFKFKDLDGKPISIKDPRYKNKVVIIDLMGSWCPNCMDETAFLSKFYNENKDRGIEVISLAYELTTDFDRSRKSLLKFQKQYDIQYPVLITGVSVSDTLRTEKTLPQFTPIKMFPTTIILDKTGKVREIDTGFQGPGTGSYFTNYVKEFNTLIDKLLAE